MKKITYYVFQSAALLFFLFSAQVGAQLLAHPEKSINVAFVDDAKNGRLNVGERLSNSAIPADVTGYLIFTPAGNLEFYHHDGSGVSQLVWQTETSAVCPGYAEVNAHYGLAVYDCADVLQWNLFAYKEEFTNYHLALETNSIRLYDMDSMKLVWQVNAWPCISDCEGVVDNPITDAVIENIHDDQGWTHTSLTDNDFDYDRFLELYNVLIQDGWVDEEVSHSDTHRFLRSLQSRIENPSIGKKVGHFLDVMADKLGAYGQKCLLGDLRFCKDDEEPLMPTLEAVYDETKIAIDYVEAIVGINDKLDSGEFDPVALFDLMMPSIMPDEQTDIEMYEALAGLLGEGENDDVDSVDGRDLRSDAEIWFRGKFARLIGKHGGRIKFDLAPYETLISFQDLLQVVDPKVIEDDTESFFNSIQVRVYFTWPAYDPVRNEARYSFRVKIQDLAGAKLVGPEAGALDRYKLDFDAGLSSSHEWIRTYSHRLDTLENKLVEKKYASGLSLLAEGTESFGELIRLVSKSSMDSLGSLASQTDSETNIPSDLSHTEEVDNIDQANQTYNQIQLSRSALTQLLEGYENLTTDGQQLVDLLMRNESAGSPAGFELEDGTIGENLLSSVLEPIGASNTYDGYLYSPRSGIEEDVTFFTGFSPQEATVLENALERGYGVHQSVSALVEVGRTGSAAPGVAAVGQFEVVETIIDDLPKEATRSSQLLGFLKTSGLILSGQVELGLSCGISTVYDLSKFETKDTRAVAVSELAAIGMTGVSGAAIAAYLEYFEPTNAIIAIGNASSELGGYVIGDVVAREIIGSDKYDKGWNCGFWGAYRPEKFLSGSKSLQSTGLPILGVKLGLGQRLRIQYNQTFAGTLSATLSPIPTKVHTVELQDVTEDFKEYRIHTPTSEEFARLEFIQTYNDTDTANTRSKITGSGIYEVFIEEEQTKDNEVKRDSGETVGVLAMPLGDIVDISGDVIGEAGRIEVNAEHANDKKSLMFSNTYTNPVVVMAVNTYVESEPVHIRLLNLNSNSVEYLLEEWENVDGDGVHALETVSYVVLERGTYLLEGGKMLVANTAVATTDDTTDFKISSYAGANEYEAGSQVLVFAQPQQGEYDPVPIVARAANVSEDGFSLRLQREEKLSASTGREQSSFIVIGDYDFTTGNLASQLVVLEDSRISSYGDQYNGEPSGSALVEGGGTTLSMDGNQWLSIDFDYNITPKTVLEFTFQSKSEGAIHAIGFDDDSLLSPEWAFQVYGTEGFANKEFTYSADNGTDEKFYIPVGSYFTGSFNRLVLIHSDDTKPFDIVSKFSNVKVYEDGSTTPQPIDFNNFTQSAHGEFGDTSNGNVKLDNNGQSIVINGNRWVSMDIDYNVTKDTYLSFTFESDKQGEIHAIGFDNGNRIPSEDRMFQIYGTQQFGIQGYKYTGNGPETFLIPVGNYFTGQYDRLVFAHDNDEMQFNFESTYSDIRIFDDVRRRLLDNGIPIIIEASKNQGSVSAELNLVSSGNWLEDEFLVLVGGELLNLGQVACDDESTDPKQGRSNNIAWALSSCEIDVDGASVIKVRIFIDNPEGATEVILSPNLEPGSWDVDRIIKDDFYTPVGNITGLVNFNISPISSLADSTSGVATTFNNGFSLFLQAQPESPGGLSGDVWESIAIEDGYDITPNTFLEFTFESIAEEGELHAIGFYAEASDGLREELKIIQVYGTQLFGDQSYNIYEKGNGKKVYRIPISAQTSLDVLHSLVFAVKNGEGVRNVNSFFSNIRLYDTDSSYCFQAVPIGSIQIEKVLAYGADSSPIPIPRPFNFYQGEEHKFDVYFTNPDGLDTYYSLWLDSNGDGDFDSQLINGESSQSANTAYGYLQIPSSGWIGETVMRVVLSDSKNDTHDACSLSGNTAYQDIPVNLTADPTPSFSVDSGSETIEVQWDMVISDDYRLPIRPEVAGQQIVLPTDCLDSCSETSGMTNGVSWSIFDIGSQSINIRRLRVSTSTGTGTDTLGTDITLDFSDNLSGSGSQKVQQGWSHGNFVVRSFNLNQGAVNFTDSFPQGHGGPGEDEPSNGSFTVEEGGSALSMSGNRWLHILFDYKVTDHTILEFDFESNAQGEIHGIGFDDDEELSPSWFFQVYGTEPWGIQDYATYGQNGGNNNPSVKSFKIPVGEFFQGDFSRLVFALDDDAGEDASATFSNVRVYETGPPAITVDPMVLPVAQYGSFDERTGVSCSEPPPDSDLNNTQNGLAPPSDCTAGVVIAGDSVDVNTTGNYQVTFDYTSTLDGEAAAQVSRTVRVMSKPVITVDSASVLVYQAQNMPYDEFERVTCGYDVVDQVDCLPDVVITSDVDVNTPDTYTITYSYTNPAGTAADTKTRTVKVQGKPVITLVGPPSVSHAQGTDFTEFAGVICTFDGDDGIGCSYDVDWEVVDSNGNVVGTSVSGDGIGTSTPTGKYTISYVYTNEANLTADIVARTVTVMGKPTLTVEPLVQTHAQGAPYDVGSGVSCTMQSVTTEDCSAEVAYQVVDGDGNAVVDGITSDTEPGEYLITYSFTNAAGLSADPVSRTVTVMGRPIITVDSASVTIEAGTDFDELSGVSCTMQSVTTEDCLAEVAYQVVDGDGNAVVDGITSDTEPGEYLITYSFTNTVGLSAQEVTRTVIVEDSIKTVMTFDSGSDGKVTLPLIDGGVYDFTVDWGDGSSDTITAWDQAENTHTYSAVNTLHTITIRGQLEGFSFHNSPSRSKIREISQWGELALSSENVSPGSYFRGVSSLLKITAEDAPDLSTTTNMSYAFSDTYFSPDNLSAWDTSSVTDMSYMLYRNFAWVHDIGDWDTSSVTNMAWMAYFSYWFNEDISSWDTSSVTNMRGMFSNAYEFNADISSWDTSAVTNMGALFLRAYEFNQPIGDWDTSAVTDMSYMFYELCSFNHLIVNWDTSSVMTMERMFFSSCNFDQDLSGWDISNVTNFKDFRKYADPLSTLNYNKLLLSWGNQALNYPQGTSVLFHAGTSKYSGGGEVEGARTSLLDYGWSITDGGPAD